MSQILWIILQCPFLVHAEEIEEVWWSAVYVAESIQKNIALLVVGAEKRLYAFIGVQALVQDITSKNVLAEDQLNDVVYGSDLFALILFVTNGKCQCVLHFATSVQ